MLSHKVLTRQDIGKVSDYYRGVDESYWGKEGGPSQWQGKGAALLGLEGEVDARRFGELLQGQVESGKRGVRQSVRHDRKERIGLDLTFSPPKSASMRGLVHGDEGIIAAHDRAVIRTLEHAEQRAQAKTKEGGKSRIETTGNLIIATFRHETTREQDPQLHTHCVLMNLTRRADGQWRALTNDEIIKSVRYLQAVYLSELATELQKAGYPLRHGPNGSFELAGISREEIEAFSKRTPQIKAHMEARGLTAETASTSQKQAAKVNSRAAKTQVERAALHAEWQKTAHDLGIDFSKSAPSAQHVKASDRSIADRPRMEAATRSLTWAVAHLTEREAVVDQRTLFAKALEHGRTARVQHADVVQAAERMLAKQTKETRQVGGARKQVKQANGGLIKEAPVYRPAADKDDPGKTREQWIASVANRALQKDYFERSRDLLIDPKAPQFVRQAIPEMERIAPAQALADIETLTGLARKRAKEGDRLGLRERDYFEASRDLLIGSATSEFVRRAVPEMERSDPARALRDLDRLRDLAIKRALESGVVPDARTTEQQMAVRQAQARVDHAIAAGRLTRTDVRYTTPVARQREETVLSVERNGRGAVKPIMDADLARAQLARAKLNAGQRESALLIATTSNRVVGIQGYAGTGKSHMLKQTRSLIEPTMRLFAEQGYTVRAVAPYGTQVRALRELGVESQTLASWLTAKDRKLDAKTVLVIDEAGVVPSRLMAQALKEVEKAGARAVLLGDTAQTKAVEAGRPFDQLQHAGMTTAHMDEIRRQKNARLKEAAELAAVGKADESLLKLTAIHEIKHDGERWATIAARYAGLAEADRAKTLIVSGTNEARHAINESVRAQIGLAGKGIKHDTLIRQDTTIAERSLAREYTDRHVIQPERNYPKLGLERGVLYHVTGHEDDNKLVVTPLSAPGKTITFEPTPLMRISVYKPERAELSPGDLVRITRNDAALDLANGDRFAVAAVSRRSVTLRNEQRTVTLPTDKPLHLDHAYATTVHSSQGLTCDRVLIDAHSKSRTTAKDVYYVAVTRAQYEAEVFTNDAKELRGAVMRENVKHAAMDLQLDKHQRREHSREHALAA